MALWIVQYSLTDAAMGNAQIKLLLNVPSILAAQSAAYTLSSSIMGITSAAISSIFVMQPVTGPSSTAQPGPYATVENQMIMRLTTSAAGSFLWLTVPAPVASIVGSDSNQSLIPGATAFTNFFSAAKIVGVVDKYGHTLGSASDATGTMNSRMYTVPTTGSIPILYSPSSMGNAVMGSARIQ